MNIDDLINAQFNRAVEIVQSLPKTGPIQTGYEEKLAMYSLYKQATLGNVKTSRPGMWDMLGRAKWDEWAKHKDLDKREAQWMYVETLKKVRMFHLSYVIFVLSWCLNDRCCANIQIERLRKTSSLSSKDMLAIPTTLL
ncbi:ACBP-domain-containing protein [Ceratobasidium sp. AG-I]|nr:ACBP-domain-containing protein [Ceratobasidium sp. AG-I]